MKLQSVTLLNDMFWHYKLTHKAEQTVSLKAQLFFVFLLVLLEKLLKHFIDKVMHSHLHVVLL